MTKTILVTNLIEIKLIKISCKQCGYAMHLPLKVPDEIVYHKCPSCHEDLPISHKEIGLFLRSLRSLKYVMKNNNFSNTLIEIETTENT